MKKLWKNVRLGVRLTASYVSTNRRQFLLGFFLSILAVFFLPKLSPLLAKPRIKTIGMVGNYTFSTLPRSIQEEISYGLVKLDATGQATNGAAVSWTATDSGKVFVFKLNPDLYWQDGERLKSTEVNYNLKGVDIERPDDQTVKFVLKDPFAPLVALLSQPLFKKGLVGLGDTKVVDLKLNGRFLSQIRLNDKVIKFYPSEKAAVTALKLGTIREIENMHSKYELDKSPFYGVSESVDNQVEAIVFFNNQKKPFDDKTFRQGLIYALPDSFSEGEAADSPIPKDNWAAASAAKKYSQNTELANKLAGKTASNSAGIEIVLTTSRELEPVAQRVVHFWKNAGIAAQVQVSDILPVNYDAYLTYVDLPADPDQYFLWHSTQTGNIAGYKSFKVDKLLEEGRKETDTKARKDIYANFARAITEDVPAAFLFYPRIYTITRL